MYPQGLATALGSNIVPFQLTFLFISLLVTIGMQTSALVESMLFPFFRILNTCKLKVRLGLYVSSVILVKVSQLVHEINGCHHGLLNLYVAVITKCSWWCVILCLHLNNFGHFYKEVN
jgi:hypothetical protein